MLGPPGCPPSALPIIDSERAATSLSRSRRAELVAASAAGAAGAAAIVAVGPRQHYALGWFGLQATVVCQIAKVSLGILGPNCTTSQGIR